MMDQIAVFDRALSSREIRALIPGVNGPISQMTLWRYVCSGIVPKPSFKVGRRNFWTAEQARAIAARFQHGVPFGSEPQS